MGAGRAFRSSEAGRLRRKVADRPDFPVAQGAADRPREARPHGLFAHGRRAGRRPTSPIGMLTTRTARARGKQPGRQPLDPDRISAALKLVATGLPPTTAARQIGSGRSTDAMPPTAGGEGGDRHPGRLPAGQSPARLQGPPGALACWRCGGVRKRSSGLLDVSVYNAHDEERGADP